MSVSASEMDAELFVLDRKGNHVAKNKHCRAIEKLADNKLLFKDVCEPELWMLEEDMRKYSRQYPKLTFIFQLQTNEVESMPWREIYKNGKAILVESQVVFDSYIEEDME